MFTTYTRLNTGLRLQRGPELDGDLERELHQNRAQLDEHPVSPVAVLRLRQQVVVCVCVYVYVYVVLCCVVCSDALPLSSVSCVW